MASVKSCKWPLRHPTCGSCVFIAYVWGGLLGDDVSCDFVTWWGQHVRFTRQRYDVDRQRQHRGGGVPSGGRAEWRQRAAAVGLSDAKTEGEFGLGLRSEAFGSMHPELLRNKTLIESIDNFSLYLTTNDSFLLIGGTFTDQLEGYDNQELSNRGLATRFTLPLRLDKNRELSGWDLSFSAVRFANDLLLYPRLYSSSETPGGDAIASVSLNEPILKMPPSIATHLCEKYLTSSCAPRGDGKGGYECVGLKLSSFPRIAIYIGDKIFHLKASDYAVETKSQLLILVSASSSESRWVLGGPFLRKFSSMFSLSGRRVDLLCQFNVGCDSRARGGAWDPQPVPTSQSDASNVTPSVIAGDPTTLAPAAPIPLAKTVVIWTGFSFGLVGFFLVIINGIRQRRHRNDPNFHGTGTVASDKDLEELVLAARDLSSSSEARVADFTPLVSTAAGTRI